MKPCGSINVYFDANYRVPVEVQMQRVHDAGFRRLDMNFWDWSNDDWSEASLSPFTSDSWREWVGHIADAAVLMGVKFTQAHADVYNFYQEGFDSPHEERIRRSIEGAGMLGVPWIVLHPSQRPDYEQPESEERMLAENAEYFRRHAERAAKWNVGLALENMSRPRGGLTSAKQLLRLVELIDMPNVGICWDTGHANLSGQNQPESIVQMRGKLHALHIADNFGEKDDHMAPYFGTVDWPPIIEALRASEYDGDFTFEAHMLVRRVPEPVKPEALKLMYRIGETLALEP